MSQFWYTYWNSIVLIVDLQLYMIRWDTEWISYILDATSHTVVFTWSGCIDDSNAILQICADRKKLMIGAARTRIWHTVSVLCTVQCICTVHASTGSKYSSGPLPAAVWIRSPAINTSVAYRRNTISKQYRTRESHHTRMHRASKRQMASGDRIRGQHVQLKMCNRREGGGWQTLSKMCTPRHALPYRTGASNTDETVFISDAVTWVKFSNPTN